MTSWFRLIIDKNNRINPYLIKKNHYYYWFTLFYVFGLLIAFILADWVIWPILAFSNNNITIFVVFTLINISYFIWIWPLNGSYVNFYYSKPAYEFLILFYKNMYFYYFNENMPDTFKKNDECFTMLNVYFEEKEIFPQNILKINKKNISKEEFIKKSKLVTKYINFSTNFVGTIVLSFIVLNLIVVPILKS